MKTHRHSRGWNLYRVTIRYRGGTRSWDRFAPSAAEVRRTTAKVARSEFGAGASVVSVKLLSKGHL